MEAVVSVLSKEVGRTVLDETRLNGKYNFTLEWEPDYVRPVAGNDNGLAQIPPSTRLLVNPVVHASFP
jgi:uncharacterized protein (TIGR03435 family)